MPPQGLWQVDGYGGWQLNFYTGAREWRQMELWVNTLVVSLDSASSRSQSESAIGGMCNRNTSC